MKTLQFNRNSWHYKLANNADGFCGSADFCQYIRYVITGFSKYVFAAALGIYCLVAIGETIGWISAGIMHGFVDPKFFGLYEVLTIVPVVVVVGGFTLVVAMVFAIMVFDYFKDWMRARAYKRFEAEQNSVVGCHLSDQKPSFIKHAYLSIKDKMCFKVEFK